MDMRDRRQDKIWEKVQETQRHAETEEELREKPSGGENQIQIGMNRRIESYCAGWGRIHVSWKLYTKSAMLCPIYPVTTTSQQRTIVKLLTQESLYSRLRKSLLLTERLPEEVDVYRQRHGASLTTSAMFSGQSPQDWEDETTNWRPWN
jgi:hypothetical protein